jgi:hypothetical protein
MLRGAAASPTGATTDFSKRNFRYAILINEVHLSAGNLSAKAPGYFPHTSFATSTASLSFAHCSSSVRTLPSSVEAKPHCGETAS